MVSQYIIPFVTAIILIVVVLGAYFLFQTNPSVATFITRQWAIVTMVILIVTMLLALYSSQSRKVDLQLHSSWHPNLPILYEVHVTGIDAHSNTWKFDTTFSDDTKFIKDVAGNKINIILANGTFYKPTYASQDTLKFHATSSANINTYDSSSFSQTLIQVPAVIHVLGWNGH